MYLESLGDAGVAPDKDQWILHGNDDYIEYSYRMWSWLRSIDWKVLPDSGGLQDQDEMLMENIFTIQWMHEVIKQNFDVNRMDEQL